MYKYFDYIYNHVLEYIRANGTWQYNQRTNTNVLATHGYSFRWDLNYAPLTMCRPMYMRTMAAEVAWMLSGEKSTAWLSEYTGIWKDFEDEPGKVETAYGYIWRSAFEVDQIQYIINLLKKDPSSRQAVLLSWDPRNAGKGYKNVACPYTAVFNIIEGKLNCHLTLRSNDALYGLPYDVGMYTLLSQALANELDCEPGELFYSIAHLHLYENQLPAVDAIITTRAPYKSFEFRHEFTVQQIFDFKDSFVAHITSMHQDLGYRPMNATKGLLPKVVL